VADRVRTVEADLDAAWPELEPVDLVWASASLHHMADPDRVLAEAFAGIRPGGLLALVEMNGFPRFLPDDVGLGRPGLEERCHAALDHLRDTDLPHFGADWGPRLSAVGFTIEGERTVAVELTPPLPAAAPRYAQASLRRMRDAIQDQLSADDLAALDALLDGDGPDSILKRGDLSVRAARPVWVARRP
jgi:SAM-dependent methyltransferase